MTRAEPSGSQGVEHDPSSLHEFENFYKTTVQRTLSIAYQFAGRNWDVAYDATQEAYVVMWERWLTKDKPKYDASSFVVKIAINKVADHFRSRRRWESWDCQPDRGCDDDGYEEALSRMTIFALVRRFLDNEPPRRRTVGILYLLGEFDYTSIAATLEINYRTVCTHMKRIREKLQPLANKIIKDGEGGGRS